MEDIHSPSVAGSSSIAAAAVAPSTRNEEDPTKALFELMAEKDRVEEELKALGAVLDSHKVNMKTSLTTFDGYPRDDIDIPQIRHTRTRIICLRNDYKDLMKRIELGLHAHHARLAAAAASEETAVAAATSTLPTTTSTTTTVRTTAASTAEIHTPFAKINSVAEGSPAAEAGMQAGDYIKKFGWVHALNHEKLKKLTECVAANDGHPIAVLLSRKEAGSLVERTVSIVPRAWAGNGKLGCHILPL
ncbi:26S proteasome non-ATPase regulatory subunit 9 [Tricharina praecox]|uniref:26S proteasome non-ATPase regulatory subunit 9 n=1 Tax=Tricharina praecox TaxID=43433 RepID=UPI0022200511|nr:26S proteasome non-ATPase regulatory subunit 9 [Tricharina praecox]KAI5850633.1 26S proteasome non-ATPase regulatory subunit 9 [Tricharina praecox]